MISFNSEQLTAICGILAETSAGLTKGEITHLLNNTHIVLVDDGKRDRTWGLNKRNWLYNCLSKELNTTQNSSKVCSFIENALSPVRFISEDDRGQHDYFYTEINKVLLLMGYQINKSGKIVEALKAKTLSEVDRRVNELGAKLYHRAIHSEVKKYCIKDYLRADYFDAIFEASKGLAQRVREITGLQYDGGQLFQTAFATNSPYLFFNSMKTESEKSEFKGLKELLEAIYHLVRNPTAHTPKINWKTDETKALDILTLISFAHKYLDECHPVPR